MLAKAKQKNCYRNLYEADLTRPLTEILDSSYDGILSAGTFTNGHVGPVALDELLRIARPNAQFTLSVNATHWRGKAFDKAFLRLAARITCVTISDIQIYGDMATGPHKDDICHLVQFRKK
jgi:sugar phosphate isomerase/epimerase